MEGADAYGGIILESRSVALLCHPLYRPAIGCVMFLMIGTRPDIEFAECPVPQLSEKALVKHLTGVKRVLRCIYVKRDHCVCSVAIKTIALSGIQPPIGVASGIRGS